MAEDFDRLSQGELGKQDGCIVVPAVENFDLPQAFMPVVTSTPVTVKVCPRLQNSVVPFPKMDDSGLSDILHTSPALLTSIQLPTPSLSSDSIAQLTPSLTSQISSIEEMVGANGVTSTPISSVPGAVLGRQLMFTAENPQRNILSDSPWTSSCTCSENSLHQSQFGGKRLLARQASHSDTHDDKLYEICSIWEEEESQDQTDEAYFSASRSLEFDGSGQQSDLVDSFNYVLRHFSPPVPSRLIGRKIGVEKVDLVSELSTYGLDVISLLLPYLLPVDVVRMCLVSSQWRRICLRHPKARQLRQQYLSGPALAEDMGKENRMSPGKMRSNKRALTVSSGQLAEIQPLDLSGVRVPVAPTSVMYSSLYDQTRQELRWEERLRHCPKCHSVSKILTGQERGQCLSQHCQADFCIKCFAPYHYPSPCAPILIKKSKTDSVGSKRSKKNLKRLI